MLTALGTSDGMEAQFETVRTNQDSLQAAKGNGETAGMGGESGAGNVP